MRDSRKTRDIFILTTNSCNLNCSYCYETKKNGKVVDIDKIKYSLQEDFSLHASRHNEFCVVFHGGEPFLAFDEMKEISEWLWNTYPQHNIYCLATTNGTYLMDSMKQWLTIHKQHFISILSLDGTREVHNRNRCDSYDKIDLPFFKELWPYQAVKMTISPDSLSDMFDSIMDIQSKGFVVNPSLAKEVDWDLGRDIPVFAKELNKLIQHYLSHPEESPCELINISPDLFSRPLPHNRACGAGDNIMTFDINGNKYPCHTFITDFNAKYDVERIMPLFDALQTSSGDIISPGCRDCLVYPCCSPCYGLNFSKRGDMGSFDPIMCEFTKIRVKASAYMYSQMIARKQNNYKVLANVSDNQLKEVIAGIKIIMNNISIN